MNKQTIERAARKMAADTGLINVTRAGLCRRLEIPEGSFQHIMGGVTFSELIESIGPDARSDGSAVSRSRALPGLRRSHILASAIALALEVGYSHVTRADVAEAAGVSPALVTRYFESMDLLRHNIMETAVQKDIPRLVAQGLANFDPVAQTASVALKRRAADILIKS